MEKAHSESTMIPIEHQSAGAAFFDVKIEAWDANGTMLTCGFRRFDHLPTDVEIEQVGQDTITWNKWAQTLRLRILPTP
jgi:hypothetical protein